MGQNASVEEGLSVVFVDDESERAIVPIGGDEGPVDPTEDCVTAEGIRRAARTVRDRPDGRDTGVLSAVTSGGLGL